MQYFVIIKKKFDVSIKCKGVNLECNYYKILLYLIKVVFKDIVDLEIFF